MTDIYSLLLATEGGIVAIAGFVIAYLSATNAEVILYSQAIALLGFGLGAAGIGIVAIAVDYQTVATGLMAVAALSSVISGWQIATDAIAREGPLATEQLAGAPSRGFEEDP